VPHSTNLQGLKDLKGFVGLSQQGSLEKDTILNKSIEAMGKP
jgi:hypothetical protein